MDKQKRNKNKIGLIIIAILTLSLGYLIANSSENRLNDDKSENSYNWIIGDWYYLDKDSFYVEFQITKDTIYRCHEEWLHSMKVKYTMTDSTIDFLIYDYIDNDSVMRHDFKKIDNTEFILEFNYSSITKNDTLIKKIRHNLYKIDPDEFTMSDVREWSYLDGKGKRIESDESKIYLNEYYKRLEKFKNQFK